MYQRSRLVSLPSALLILLAAASQGASAAADPGFAPPLALPTSPAERQVLHRRHAEIERRLLHDVPVAVRKMSEDPGEKFFPEFWTFGADNHHLDRPSYPLDGDYPRGKGRIGTHRTARPIQETESSNNSAPYEFLPAMLPHSYDLATPMVDARGLAGNLFDKRGYQCPTGFHNCASIGYKNSCCGPDETCKIIADTGVGVVGCCPSGNTCTGSVSSCDTAHGYKSCPNRRDKNGCCAPGFTCDAIGCIKIVGGETVSTTRQVTVIESSSTTVDVTTTTITSTAVVGPTGQSTVYTTSTYATQTKIVGPVVQSFSTDTEIFTTTITRGGPPLPSTEIIGGCPTGYYRCSAFYLGGCCRVGRDCHSTHCPARESADATQNGVVTVVIMTGIGATTITEGTFTVVPTGSSPIGGASATTSPIATGPCALGWSPCGAAGGGGCCPNGYSCAASCIATVTGIPGKVLKAPPINQAVFLQGHANWLIGIAGAIGLGMIWL